MRILISIIAFLVGLGLIAYSYVGSLVSLVGDVGEHAQRGDDISAVSTVLDFLMRGEIAQLTGFFYLGGFVIAFSIVNLIVKRNKDDREDSI